MVTELARFCADRQTKDFKNVGATLASFQTRTDATNPASLLPSMLDAIAFHITKTTLSSSVVVEEEERVNWTVSEADADQGWFVFAKRRQKTQNE